MKNIQTPLVDEWKPNAEDIIFTNTKNIIFAPIANFYHLEEGTSNQIDYFFINPKKSYNSDDERNHYCQYVNYFEKFYDSEKEYFTNLAHIKFTIDVYNEYREQDLIVDLNRYILQPSIFAKVNAMVERNYSLELNYKSNNNPQLQYKDVHAKALMEMSILMNLCIPLITHFAYMKRIDDIDEFILDVYDYILYSPIFDGRMDINSKLYETAKSNVRRNEINNMGVWMKQNIRGKDAITHTMDASRNIIINIIPKYTFDKSMISLNYTSIQKNNKYKITDIKYEYSYIPLSSSRREGEDSTSDFDRYESGLIKVSEMMYLQSNFNYEYVINKITERWGPFDEDEINFYINNLKNENGEIVNKFQKELIFNLFYKYYGDTQSIRDTNNIEYVKLMLAGKKMLLNNNMIFLPYILSSKAVKIISRKSLNKKELVELQSSPYYQMVLDKYKSEKIMKQIFATIATIITSTFNFIDYHDRELNGNTIMVDTKIIENEFLLYALII